MDYIKEGYNVNYPEWISLDKTKDIVRQMEHSICKIINNGIKGTGFFTKIYFQNKNKYIPVLITNNHIIDESNLNNEKQKVIIEINNKKEYLYLNDRMNYTNENHDISIIEIKEKEILNLLENNNQNYYLELGLYNNDIEKEELNKSSIYVIHYPKGKEVSVSYGIISRIDNDEFRHFCRTDGGSSGSPIFELNSNKVIGIHKGTFKKKNSKGEEIDENIASFLNISINEFIIKYEKENINKILCKPSSDKVKDENIESKNSTNKVSSGSFNKSNIGILSNKNLNNVSNLKQKNNEIICIYNKQDETINLLHDYQLKIIYEFKKSYEEGRRNINEDKSIDSKEEHFQNIKAVEVNNFLNLNLTSI